MKSLGAWFAATLAGFVLAMPIVSPAPAGPEGPRIDPVFGRAVAHGTTATSEALSPKRGERDRNPVAPVFEELRTRLVAQAEALTGQLRIEPADEPPPGPAGAAISFNAPLDVDDPVLRGRSIEELIVGSPVFPPIEGLDRSIWDKKNCGTCHQWTKERLCTQAKTYIGAEKMVARIEHPYGIAFKQTLERWAEGGCL